MKSLISKTYYLLTEAKRKAAVMLLVFIIIGTVFEVMCATLP